MHHGPKLTISDCSIINHKPLRQSHTTVDFGFATINSDKNLFIEFICSINYAKEISVKLVLEVFIILILFGTTCATSLSAMEHLSDEEEEETSTSSQPLGKSFSSNNRESGRKRKCQVLENRTTANDLGVKERENKTPRVDLNLRNEEPSDLKSLLLSAIDKQDEAEVLEILGRITERGEFLNSADGLDYPIHRAARVGNVGIVKQLYRNGALLELLNQNENGPIHLAAAHGHLPVVKFLEEMNVSIRSSGRHQTMAIHHAADNDHLDIVNYLLEKDEQQIAVTTKDGDTIMHFACMGSATKVIARLLEIKPDFAFTPNYKGFKPIHYAAHRMNRKLVKELSATKPELAVIEEYALINLFANAESRARLQSSPSPKQFLELATEFGFTSLRRQLLRDNPMLQTL